ncbi:MAG: methylated-DNA--[protein]-cysteine S-methyltransferase [Fibrella sp.]|nr:methylated-DNA--[protein]-cysteine S-methyltransferase [Armatimonadota bacterium]
MTTDYAYIESPIGQLLLTVQGGTLTGVYMNEHKNGVGIGTDWVARETPVIAEATRQLGEYFAGTRRLFDLPVAPPIGTPFQHAVWRQLCDIPYGETITYGELARRIGDANAARAVGAANGRNPVSIIVPCHRVIGASGKLTGYAGGESRKAFLLAHEKGAGDVLAL